VTATVILAGGKGARMGGNKPLSPWRGSTLIAAVIDRLKPQADPLVINADPVQAEALRPLDLPLIFDAATTAGRGPLSGVLSALTWAAALGETFVITAPCDMPDLPADMVARLVAAPEADIVHFTGARDYPLCARWAVRLRPRLTKALEAAPDGLAVMRFIATHHAVTLPADDDSAFININTPDAHT
jgi:molybdopterin-guanine dinucleotide biosynthesis protein A